MRLPHLQQWLGGFAPDVAPHTTTVPPGRRARSECAHVASPTVSTTQSTRSGSRAPDSNAASAPTSNAQARFAGVRAVAQTRNPNSRPSWIAAVATPPDAPCTKTVSPESRRQRRNIR